MGFIENMIESFSAKDLKSRIGMVITAGLILCIASAAALYVLLTSVQRITVEGTARWAGPENELNVSIDASDFGKFLNRESITVELLDPTKGKIPVACDILSIEPEPPTVSISCTNLPAELRAKEKIDATLVLFQDPLWKMLWGNR